ncbi:hypothetical protein D3C73_1355940 [compost metagenome]
MFFTSSRFSGTSGMRPLAKPTETIRALAAAARTLRSKASPPTASSTTSAPRPPLAALTACTMFSSAANACAAPAASAAWRLVSVLAQASTVAPSDDAISTAAKPTPDPAPSTSTVSPGCMAARHSKAHQAVP